MDIIPLPSQLPDFLRYLTTNRIVRYRPTQIDESGALNWADGVEIILVFNSMTPARFAQFLPLILQSAEWLVSRYDGEYYSGRFEVRLIGQSFGRGRRRRYEDKTYGSSLHRDSSYMVWGEGEDDRTLMSQAQRILDIVDQYIPGFFLAQDAPVLVREMRLNVRNPYDDRYQSRRERRGIE